MKFKDIQTKIKLLYLSFMGKIRKKNTPIEISNQNKKVIKNILIIFPIKEEEFRVAVYTFRNLIKNNDVNYYFIVNSIYKHHFNLSGYVFDLFYDIKKQKVKFDETFFEERIINKEFDMIIDLNCHFNYDISSFINNLESYYKIGFKNMYSDYFYNIQINFNEDDTLENSYNKINLMLN